MSGNPQPDLKLIPTAEADALAIERQRSRERRKLIGLCLIALFILLLALLRFGRSIPWSAR